jgi:hypothetical protein
MFRQVTGTRRRASPTCRRDCAPTASITSLPRYRLSRAQGRRGRGNWHVRCRTRVARGGGNRMRETTSARQSPSLEAPWAADRTASFSLPKTSKHAPEDASGMPCVRNRQGRGPPRPLGMNLRVPPSSAMRNHNVPRRARISRPWQAHPAIRCYMRRASAMLVVSDNPAPCRHDHLPPPQLHDPARRTSSDR